MNNCGISFGNDFKYVAEGDSFIIHHSLSIGRRSLPDKWQFTEQGIAFLKKYGIIILNIS